MDVLVSELVMDRRQHVLVKVSNAVIDSECSSADQAICLAIVDELIQILRVQTVVGGERDPPPDLPAVRLSEVRVGFEATPRELDFVAKLRVLPKGVVQEIGVGRTRCPSVGHHLGGMVALANGEGSARSNEHL